MLWDIHFEQSNVFVGRALWSQIQVLSMTEAIKRYNKEGLVSSVDWKDNHFWDKIIVMVKLCLL